MSYPTRTLADLTVSAEGLGCMGMSEFYGAGDDAESLAVIRGVLDLGVTFLDTADMYGPFTHERLVNKATNLARLWAAVPVEAVRGDRYADMSPIGR